MMVDMQQLSIIEILLTVSATVTTLQIGSYSGLDSSPYGIPSGNHIEDRPVYLVYCRET